jgi:hypothetical protein
MFVFITSFLAEFNCKLKRLKTENTIIPIKQFINLVLEQFKGEQGEKFQNACATFCQNQREAMNLLQAKMKHDRFASFLSRAENDQICRKLHLKDFIPTEVQRLVKYKLLFSELTKNAMDDEDRKKLDECVDASNKISQHVNKAVTICENRKRTDEIQSRIDTKEFDQYCVKSPLLAQYKNLDLRSRKLIYEGELEWKTNGIKLMTLLFEDILVFLEFEREKANERRYVLRPLLYTINKSRHIFTPVIPLSCINSFAPMPEKRNFHLVVIIGDDNLKLKHKAIQTQMLFILITKSGDERNKWIQNLQELTGKLSQADKQLNSIDLTLTNNQSSTTSLISLATNQSNSSNNLYATSVSSSNLIMSNSQQLNSNQQQQSQQSDQQIMPDQSIQTPLMSEMMKVTNDDVNKKTNKSLYDAKLLIELNENTERIMDLLEMRGNLLAKLLKTDRRELNAEIEQSETINSNELIINSIEVLNRMSKNLLENSELINRLKLNENILKLESNLHTLQKNISQTGNQTDNAPHLPHLQLPQQSQMYAEHKLFDNMLYKSGKLLNLNQNMDLVSSSVLSTSTTADLSEDEQINYYDEDEENDQAQATILRQHSERDQQEEHEQQQERASGEESQFLNVSNHLLHSHRRVSNSSDGTLVLIPANSTITESINFNSSPRNHESNHVKKKKHEHRVSNTSSEANFDQMRKRMNPLSAQSSCDANGDYFFENRIDGYYGDNDRESDDDDEEDDEDDESIENFEDDDDEEEEILNAETSHGELEEQGNLEREEDADLNEGIANRNRKHRMQNESVNDSTRVNTYGFSPNNNRLRQHESKVSINDESSDDRSYNEHIISVPVLSVMQSAIDTNGMMGNDLSDDEVKEYHTFKETLDDDSNV